MTPPTVADLDGHGKVHWSIASISEWSELHMSDRLKGGRWCEMMDYELQRYQVGATNEMPVLAVADEIEARHHCHVCLSLAMWAGVQAQRPELLVLCLVK